MFRNVEKLLRETTKAEEKAHPRPKVSKRHDNKSNALGLRSRLEAMKWRKYQYDCKNARSRDLMHPGNYEKSQALKTKSKGNYCIEDYMTAYDPHQMYEVLERITISGYSQEVSGTPENKEIGEYVRVCLSSHCLDNKVGRVVAIYHGKCEIRTTLRNKTVTCRLPHAALKRETKWRKYTRQPPPSL